MWKISRAGPEENATAKLECTRVFEDVVGRHLRERWRVRARHFSGKSKQAPSFYTILGVKRHASLNDIKQAYIEKAKVYHPDVRRDNVENTGDSVSIPGMSFEMLKEAYDVLSDPIRRSSYDMTLKNAYADGRPPNSEFLSSPKKSASTLQAQSKEMRKKYAKEKSDALPMWYVGQEKPSQHQVYYYKKTVAAERAFDSNHSRQARQHKIIPISRARSLIWVASPLVVAGIWLYNYSSWGKQREKDPFEKFRVGSS